MRTEQEIRALIGQTFGSGKMQRTVTRIESLEHRHGNYQYWSGHVFWKRPGGKERGQSQWLPYFFKWLAKAEREADRHPIHTIQDIQNYLSAWRVDHKIKGSISVDGDETTIVFTVKP